jgi:hypothetical protein
MKQRRGRLEGGALLRFGVLIAALSCGWADAQDEPPPASAEPEIHPDAVSPFETRVYKIKPKRLWKGLLEALEEAGFPPEEIDEGSWTIRTSFVDFKQSDYSEQVAGRPPLFGPDYQIYQKIPVVEGKVSLEATVSEKDRGSELRLGARLLVQGLDRRRSIMVLTDRRSSGVIESEFLAKLEEKLGLKRL